jgi:hypothetical protein
MKITTLPNGRRVAQYISDDAASYQYSTGDVYDWAASDRPVDPHAKAPGHDEAARLMRANPGMQFLDALAYVNGGEVAQYATYGRGELGGEFSLANVARAYLEIPTNGSPHTIVHAPVRQNWSPGAQRDLADSMVRRGAGTIVTDGTRSAAEALRQTADELPRDEAAISREDENRAHEMRLAAARAMYKTNGGDWQDYKRGFKLRYDATPNIEDNPLHKKPAGHDAVMAYVRSHPGISYEAAEVVLQG